MEIREAKQELRDYLSNKKYIEEKTEDLERLEEQINKITASYSDLPRGGSTSREDLIARKIDLERDTYAYLIELLEKRTTIERTLRSLDPKYRNILDYLYIKDKTLVEYAAKEKYSYKQCTRILGEAYVKYAEAREE